MKTAITTHLYGITERAPDGTIRNVVTAAENEAAARSYITDDGGEVTEVRHLLACPCRKEAPP